MSNVIGYVDEVSADGLIGWIADLDDPDTLAPITCCGANGMASVFYPFVPRQDVCKAIGRTGRFGFAIPPVCLEDFGSTITVSDQNGLALQGGKDISLPDILAAPDRSQPTWIVLHIQKTAGTSLRNALTRDAKPGEALFVYPDRFTGLDVREFEALPLSQRAALRLVIGHAYYGIGGFIPNQAPYATFLRQPLARLRSHYFHHHSAGSKIRVAGEDIELATIVTRGLTDEFDNLMVRMVAGRGPDTRPLGTISEADVNQALHNIRTSFRFVGLTEQIDRHAAALFEAMGLRSLPIAVENTRIMHDTSEVSALVDWDQVMHRNRFDAMLYDRVQSDGLSGRILTPTPQLP